MEGIHKSRGSFLKGQGLLWVVVIIALAVSIGTAAFYYHDSQKKQKQVQKLSNPTAVAQEEQKQLVAKVSTLTVLPQGETPTVATVTDATKLAGQPFFVNAQNGDKVLIYTKAKKAYLYRPSTNKIINIAPVNLGASQKPASTSDTSTTKKP